MRFPRVFTAFLFIAFVSLTACKQGQEKPPVDRDKMGAILLDLQLAEAYSQGLGDSVKNRFEKNSDSLTGFYTSVLKHHNLKFAEFEEAMEWYKKHPMLLDSLYNNILTKLVEIKARRGITDSEEKPVNKDSALIKPIDSMKNKPVLLPKDSLTNAIRKRLNDTIIHRSKPFKSATN